MGESVKILELAKRLIELSGLSLRDATNPHGDIEIQVTGLRPGEKLYEELLMSDNPESASHPRIMKARESFMAWDDLDLLLNQLDQAILKNDEKAIKDMLSVMVAGYIPQ
jgi:FlaA1/EpsC-like NDP-sugar epimerase